MNTKNNILDSYSNLCIFLKKYSFLFDFKLIEFFLSQNFLSCSESLITFFNSLNYADLDRIPLGYIQADWPEDVINFLRRAVEFGDIRFNYKKVSAVIDPFMLERYFWIGMSEKKRHEVERMASFVHQIALENRFMKIVDAGSGMGYLSRVLAEKYNYSVIALEGNRCTAEKSSSYLHTTRLSNYTCFNFILNSSGDSIIKLDSLLRTTWPEISESAAVCLVGLHCCADLTPCMITIFERLKYIKALICVSCCYHRMKTIDGIYFENFPMSDTFIRITKNCDFRINQYGLRLAAQETRTKWQAQSLEDHDYHLKCFAYRCILEIFNSKYNVKLPKMRRKFIRGKLDDFETFLKSQGYDEFSSNLIEIFDDYKVHFKIIEPFTMLQVLFQPILEHLITIDRIEYVKQLGFSNVDPYILFYDLISPRNIAIVAIK